MESTFLALEAQLKKAGVQLLDLEDNLVDELWRKEGTRPERPSESVTMLEECYSGLGLE